MRRLMPLAAAAALLAAPAFAESHVTGDAAAGEEAFAKQCITCHVVVNEDDETLAGRKSKTGPNLYGIAGAMAGAVEDFRYSNGLEAAAEAEIEWTEENFVGYVQDPTGWLRETLDDSKLRSKMSYKVREEEDAVNLYAYLASLAPAPEMEETEAAPASN